MNIDDEVFDAILAENRDTVLALIDRLNEVKSPLQQAVLDL